MRWLIAACLLLTACGTLRRVENGGPAPVTVVAPAGEDAVKAVIQQANEAQAKAFASGDDAAMRATATPEYFAELAQTNRDLARSGVRTFELVRIDWIALSVDGTSAHATTDETWRTTFVDGSTDERTDRNEYALVWSDGAWRIESDTHPDARRVEPAPATVPGAAPAQIASTSSNWSGYIATGGTYTSVTGTWTVPSVTATASGADATWVGIGGVGGTDLIQAGTQATVGGGQVDYQAWTEILPQTSRRVPLNVRAGDSLSVTITEQSEAQWAIAIVNNTTRETYKTSVAYRSSRSSAEWIEEAPSAGRGIVPLDEFGAIRFSASSAVRDGKTQTLAALGARSVAMINGARQVVASPSALDGSGSAFTVTRTSAPATVGGSRSYRRRG